MRSMRAVLWLVLVLGLLWAGYWFVGSRAVESSVAGWFADQQAAGMVAENKGIAVAGFADRFDLTVTEPKLADPATGWGWQAPFAQVLAMTWKPWHLIAALPHTQEITAPDGQKVNVNSSRLMASLLMKPAVGLPPRRLVVEGEGLALASNAGWTLGADKAVLAAEEDPTRTNSLRLGADVTKITVPASLATLPDLGPEAALIHADVSLGLSEPLAWAMEGAAVTAVHVTAVQVTWGKMDLTASGEVTANADGLAEGKVDMHLKGWQSLPALVVALGLVPPQNEVTVQRGLEFLSKTGKDPDVLTLPLTFAKGYMSLGPLPLGPAPRLAP